MPDIALSQRKDKGNVAIIGIIVVVGMVILLAAIPAVKNFQGFNFNSGGPKKLTINTFRPPRNRSAKPIAVHCQMVASNCTGRNCSHVQVCPYQ